MLTLTPMAATSVTIEGIELDRAHGLWCPSCHNWSVTSVLVAIVDARSLELLRRVTASECQSCGAED